MRYDGADMHLCSRTLWSASAASLALLVPAALAAAPASAAPPPRVGYDSAECGFRFVDVTSHFLDHGVNAPEPWILGLTDPGLFHPNLSGYRADTAAVTSSLNARDLR